MKDKDKYLYERNGRWYFQKIVNGKNVKRNLKTDNITEARHRRDLLIAKLTINGKDEFVKYVPTFEVVMREWLEAKSHTLREETYTKWSNWCEHYLTKASFFKKPVDKILDVEIEDFLTMFRDTCKAESIIYYLRLIGNIFNFGCRRKYLSVSPTKTAEKPKIERSGLPDPFTQDEKQLIIQSISEHYRPFIIMKFDTGMRTSEACAIRWKNVDFVRGTILIEDRLLSGVLGPTKNKYSNREIRMLKSVKDALIEQRKISLGKSEYVFLNKKGTPINTSSFTNEVWTPLLQDLKMRHRPVRNTRHTFISLALMSGVSPMAVARICGQSSPEMIYRHYAGWIQNEDDYNRMEKAFTTTLPQQKDNDLTLQEKEVI